VIEQEPLSLRWHRRTYPRHSIWRKGYLVIRNRQARRLFEGITVEPMGSEFGFVWNENVDNPHET